MARLEAREFKSKKFLLIISENEQESKLIDRILGSKVPARVNGDVALSDDYGEHYIRLSQGAKGD